MGRVINTNNPGKRRNSFMRTSAEILRRLSQQKEVDEDTKDMVAMLVYCLRGIDAYRRRIYPCMGKTRLLEKSRRFPAKVVVVIVDGNL